MPPLPGRSLFCIVLLTLAAASCNLIDTRTSRHADLSHMVAGPSADPGVFECWLTLEFKRYPEGADARDVVVRFESIALAEPSEFDWSYIAANDKLTRREGFGSGLHEAEVTRVDQKPPLGRPTKVRFPLRAKSVIENAPATLYLEAELFWGGERQHSARQTLEHIYASDEAPAG